MMEPYVPDSLPLPELDYDGQLIGLVGQANAMLARYDGLLQGIPNPEALLSPMVTQEAVLSSKIEGTVATLDEVLEHEAGQDYDEEKTKDIQEIINYRLTLMLAKDQLADRDLTLGMVKQLHSVLMNSVRGKNKGPGEFRKDQNWIGRPGRPIQEAIFVPPGPLRLQDHLDNWEAYLTHQEIDVLIQTAIVHGQFELIHPFKDGNGRVGRLLVPLYLYSRKTLYSPMFYISAYLERHRDEYYDRLKMISRDTDWSGWIMFFLQAVITQAGENADKVRKIINLSEEMKAKIEEVTHSQYSIRLLDAILDKPIFQTSHIVHKTGLAKQTITPLLRQLKNAGILVTLREPSGRRPGILAFPELLNIIEGHQIL